jgi:predicted DCC family thiol-disulfide oxidoreductase YuxK
MTGMAGMNGVTALPVLVYDGDCGFCTRSVQFGQRHIGRMPAAVAYQAADLAALGLTEAQCATAVQYVARDHRAYAGHDAVAAVLLGAGLPWWFLGALLHLPGLHWLAGVVYRSPQRTAWAEAPRKAVSAPPSPYSRARSAVPGTGRLKASGPPPSPFHSPVASISSATTGCTAVCHTTAWCPYSRMVHSLSTT